MPRKKSTPVKKEDNSKIIWLIVSAIFAVLIVFSFSRMGPVGFLLDNLFSFLFGSLYYVPIITLFIYAMYRVFFKEKQKISGKFLAGIIVLNFTVIFLSAIIGSREIVDLKAYVEYVNEMSAHSIDIHNNYLFGGGLIGNFLFALLNSSISFVGTIITLILLIIICLILLVPMSFYKQLFTNAKDKTAAMKKERDARRAQEKIERERQKERERIEREKQKERERQEEEERKLRLAEEMNRTPFVEDKVEEPVKQPVVETVKKVDHSYVLSTKSKYFINLNENELNAPSSSKPVMADPVPVNEQYEPLEIPFEKPVEEEEIISVPVSNVPAAAADRAPAVLKPKKKNGVYRLPNPNILDKKVNKSSNINKTSAEVKGQKVIEILHNFGIDATLVNTHIGPSVTKFEIKPDSSIKVNRIMNISDNIKMELAAKDIRIEAPIPGRSAVGIEIPNVERIPVKLLELLEDLPEEKKNNKLLFGLGKDLMGQSIFCDLGKMPHLLIAGSTGSGKSVCINTIICNYMFHATPSELKLVLIDPKKVEFTPYHDVPHLLWPVITEPNMASLMLKKAVVIMEERYDAFASVGVRNIQGFNEFVEAHNADLKEGESPMNKMPFIVIIIDELADLMMVAKKDVESSIQRITQLARASGIHLIVATQRPSTDVITGIIKSNIPSRISFAVASSIDSRTILDQTGAERLLGNGDMLYYPTGESSPIRLQGVYVSDEEVRKVTTHVKSQADPEYEDSYFEFLNNMNGTVMSTTPGGSDSSADDSLYDEVVEYVRETQKASTSLLQRRFGIGYNRAARLVDTLEDRGIVGPAQGSKPREVYLKKDEEDAE